jgi:signal peptidase II
MQRVNRPQPKWRTAIPGGIALLVILADQLSKWWIRENVGEYRSLFDAGFFRIVHFHNTGAAFGIFREHTLAIIIVAFIGIIVILLLVFLFSHHWPFLDGRLPRSAIGLVLGGMIGNQIDRLALGYVTDFIDFKFWPAFNIADASGVVGVFIIAYCLLRSAQLAER